MHQCLDIWRTAFWMKRHYRLVHATFLPATLVVFCAYTFSSAHALHALYLATWSLTSLSPYTLHLAAGLGGRMPPLTTGDPYFTTWVLRRIVGTLVCGVYALAWRFRGNSPRRKTPSVEPSGVFISCLTLAYRNWW